MLQTKRLLLRVWRETDAADLYRYASDPQIGPLAGWAPHTDVEESRQIIRLFLSEEETYAVVLRQSGHAIGCIDLKPAGRSNLALLPNEAELGYWLGRPYWGHGLMPEAAQALLRYGFCELGLERIWCSSLAYNHNSLRVQQKCGFVHHHEVSHVYQPLLHAYCDKRYACLTYADWLAGQRTCHAPA